MQPDLLCWGGPIDGCPAPTPVCDAHRWWYIRCSVGWLAYDDEVVGGKLVAMVSRADPLPDVVRRVDGSYVRRAVAGRPLLKWVDRQTPRVRGPDPTTDTELLMLVAIRASVRGGDWRLRTAEWVHWVRSHHDWRTRDLPLWRIASDILQHLHATERPGTPEYRRLRLDPRDRDDW